jgi:hypothetical protein
LLLLSVLKSAETPKVEMGYFSATISFFSNDINFYYYKLYCNLAYKLFKFNVEY